MAQRAPKPISMIDTNASDLEVIAAVLAGDLSRFAVLVRRYNQRMFRTARAILGNDQEAEDVVQQAYLKAFEALSSFRGDAQVATWLIRIVVHESIDRQRRYARAAELHEDQLAIEDRTPETETSDRELGGALARAIDALPDSLRAVLVLRGVEELDTPTTASVLGLSDEAVRVRLHRARTALRAAVADLDAGAASDLYPFLGARCDSMVARVMAAIGAPL
jgi:RNA polymerase sigma-70 factor (ECF subfamily)